MFNSLTQRARSQILRPYDESNDIQALDDFNRGILTSNNWGANNIDMSKSVKVLPKPRQPHPNVKYSPLSPRQKKERTFINRLVVKNIVDKIKDPDHIKRQWNQSVLKTEN